MTGGGPDRERRWLVLSPDGRYVILGRATDPSEVEICRAEGDLLRQMPGGWLAVAEGSFHLPGRPPRLMEVRCLGNPGVPFGTAVEEFAKRLILG